MAQPARAVDELHRIALMIASETDLERVLERVLRATEHLFEASSASVTLLHGGPHGQRYTTIHGEPRWVPRSEQVRSGGLTETVLTENRAVWIEDVDKDPLASRRIREFGGAVLAVPLRALGESIGVLYANFAGPRRFTQEDVSLLEVLAAYAATAIRNASLLAAERRARERQSAVLEMARAVSSSLEHPRVFGQIAHHTRSVLDADEVSIHRLVAGGSLEGIAQDPPTSGDKRDTSPWTPDPFIAATLAGTAPRVTHRPGDDPSTSARFLEKLRDVETVVAAPLWTGRDCLGVIIMLWRRPHAVDTDELQLVETVVRHATIAIQNTRALEAAVAAARLEGAIKTAHAAAHELNQPLAVVVGYGELIEAGEDPERMKHFAQLVGRAGRDAAAKLDRFQRVFRFVELRFGDLEPILDVERSSRPDEELDTASG